MLARCPYNVKRTIWEHEKDELSFDPRGGADHRTLQLKEAMALGVTEEVSTTMNYLPSLCRHFQAGCTSRPPFPG